MTNVMTVDEVAAYLRVGRMTVYKMTRGGELPGFRIGSHWRFSVKQIDHWLLEQQRTGGEQAVEYPKVLI